MVVLGIDFGNDSCVVSVCRDGRADTVTNEFDWRYTPSMVAFDQCKRIFGVSAKKQWTTNAASTLLDLKSMMGGNMAKNRIFDLCNFTKNPRGSTVSFDVNITEQTFSFSPCQVLAMLFIKLKVDAGKFLQTNEKISKCVISVPVHFTDQERKGVLLAAAIAELDCRCMIKDTTAVAISYAIYKKFLQPLIVIFIDFGQSSIQISACKFLERQVDVLMEVSELIGGRDIDEMLADHFMTAYKIQGANRKSKTFCAQLLHEVEQLKKKMSSSVQRHELLTLKQLCGGGPISMDRSEMEIVCAPLFAKIEDLMRLCLERSKLARDEIHSIELVGGSSNIPIIGQLVENVFHKIPLSTLNRDEAVARGCLLKSGLHGMRRGYKVKDIAFKDVFNSANTKCTYERRHLYYVFQAHKYLTNDLRDSFDVTRGTYLRYVETEKHLAEFELEEEQRRIARSNLDKYLLEHMKSGGVLENCSTSIDWELNETRTCDDGTKDQYIDLLYYWTEKVENMKENRAIREVEVEEVDDNSDGYQCGTSQTLVKRITFSDCDEVTVIEARENSCSTASQRARFFRKVSRLRRQRMKRNRSQSRSANIVVNQIRQRGKRLTWCCFL